MHELAVTEGILKICEEEYKKNNFKKINEIRIKVGELTGLVPNCIDYYFEIISSNTIAEGAKLIINKLPIKIHCKECSYEGEIGKGEYACPKCKSYSINIINGREFYVDSLEVDKDGD